MENTLSFLSLWKYFSFPSLDYFSALTLRDFPIQKNWIQPFKAIQPLKVGNTLLFHNSKLFLGSNTIPRLKQFISKLCCIGRILDHCLPFFSLIFHFLPYLSCHPFPLELFSLLPVSLHSFSRFRLTWSLVPKTLKRESFPPRIPAKPLDDLAWVGSGYIPMSVKWRAGWGSDGPGLVLIRVGR